MLVLDSGGRPGLSLVDFWATFTLCECGMVTTRAAFRQHLKHCTGPSDSDGESEGDLLEVEEVLGRD